MYSGGLLRFERVLYVGASVFRAVKEAWHTALSVLALVGLVGLASLAGLAILIGLLFELRRETPKHDMLR